MIDTAGTVVAAAELLKSRGALSVKVVATHGVLSPPAVDRLKNAPITEVVITNTLPVPEEAHHLDILTVLSIGPILAGRDQRHLRRRLGERHLQGREPVTPRRRVRPTTMP